MLAGNILKCILIVEILESDPLILGCKCYSIQSIDSLVIYVISFLAVISSGNCLCLDGVIANDFIRLCLVCGQSSKGK